MMVDGLDAVGGSDNNVGSSVKAREHTLHSLVVRPFRRRSVQEVPRLPDRSSCNHIQLPSSKIDYQWRGEPPYILHHWIGLLPGSQSLMKWLATVLPVLSLSLEREAAVLIDLVPASVCSR